MEKEYKLNFTEQGLKEVDFFIFTKSLFQLMKPGVMSLVIFTCVVGLLIAPVEISFFKSFMSLVAVALGAGAAGTLNMWYESDLDAVMTRTCLRPVPSGKITKNADGGSINCPGPTVSSAATTVPTTRTIQIIRFMFSFIPFLKCQVRMRDRFSFCKVNGKIILE